MKTQSYAQILFGQDLDTRLTKHYGALYILLSVQEN